MDSTSYTLPRCTPQPLPPKDRFEPLVPLFAQPDSVPLYVLDSSDPQPDHQERIGYLEKKIQTKDEVLAELMAEHVALKKSVGEL